jgi:transcriptional regulator with XRE-family HTH domain
MKIFNEHLKSRRQSRGKSQKQVATAIGIGERNYQSFEYGEVKPSFDTLIALADYFDVSLDELVGREQGCGSAVH